MVISEQVVINEKGYTVAILVPVNQYRKMREQLEELNDIKAYDAAMKRKPRFSPFESALKRIRTNRKRRA